MLCYVKVEMGDEPQYACDQGYALIQPDRFVCSSAGNYTGDQPRCVRVECPKPETVLNSDLDAPGNVLGDTVRYRCHAGFEPVGTTNRICTENGTWSGIPPSCVRVTCPAPDHVPNVIVQSGGYEFGATIEYECIEGYSLTTGSFNRTCQANKTWSGSPPICARHTVPVAEYRSWFRGIEHRRQGNRGARADHRPVCRWYNRRIRLRIWISASRQSNAVVPRRRQVERVTTVV
jgi:hypothetical protein